MMSMCVCVCVCGFKTAINPDDYRGRGRQLSGVRLSNRPSDSGLFYVALKASGGQINYYISGLIFLSFYMTFYIFNTT